MSLNILQYESKIWSTAELLRGSGIKESEWPSFMMPFFALIMVESRLIRMFNSLKTEIGSSEITKIKKTDFVDLIKDQGQGYNKYIFEQNKTLSDICKNDKTFEVDFESYLKGFDEETKDLLGVEATEGEKFLDIKGVITKLKAKKVLLGYTQLWAEIDLKPFNNSEITTLEEHIKRKWADISAETAGEQYTPDDVIALIAEIIASKIDESDKLLKIYDCTCGGGNLLFGVEDRINQKLKRLTQTFGQDWNDALYALAKIESRFRPDSKIEHGNTLVEDKFYSETFDVVIANPPYGVSWKGYQKDIENDKTERFNHLPSISDGQLLFLQHLISKLDQTGTGVVVHNGSTLFSGDAGTSESNIRKWILDNDYVEALIQLPEDEFFNTGIYTYLWILNKNKSAHQKNKVLLVDASAKFTMLKRTKGAKRKEVDEQSRIDIVTTLKNYKDSEISKLFPKEFFYYNKQGITLKKVDVNGKSVEDILPEKNSCLKLNPIKITNGKKEFKISDLNNFPSSKYSSLLEAYSQGIKPFIESFDFKKDGLIAHTEDHKYYFDEEKQSIVKEGNSIEYLGRGNIALKVSYKKATKKSEEKIESFLEIQPEYVKDFEIIPYQKSINANTQAINDFLSKHVKDSYSLGENTIGVEINFNKIFYKYPTIKRSKDILAELKLIQTKLSELETKLQL